MSITLEVLGTPAPKGSSRAFIVGKGAAARAVISPGASKVGAAKTKSWEAAVREAASQASGYVEMSGHVIRLRDAPPGAPAATYFYRGVPLAIHITFRMRRPAGHWGKRGLLPSAPQHPAVKPDIDKLVRSTLDALIGSVIDDDSRVVSLAAVKEWAEPGREGASITVREVTA